MAKPNAICRISAPQPTIGAPEITFNFFGLPRELRDEIYDRSHSTTHRKRDFNTEIQADTVNANLRLVSRLFKAEYDDRCRHFKSTLSISATSVVGLGLRLPRSISSRITHMNITLCITWGINPQIQQYALWFLDYVKKFPRLGTISVELHRDSSIGEITLDDVKDFISVRQTVALKSFYSDERHDFYRNFASPSNKLVWEWTRVGGTTRC